MAESGPGPDATFRERFDMIANRCEMAGAIMEVPPNADDDETMRSSANIVDTMFALAKDLTRLLIEVLVALTFDAPNDQALSLAGVLRELLPTAVQFDRVLTIKAGALIKGAAAWDRLHPERNDRNNIIAFWALGARLHPFDDALRFIVEPFPCLTLLSHTLFEDAKAIDVRERKSAGFVKVITGHLSSLCPLTEHVESFAASVFLLATCSSMTNVQKRIRIDSVIGPETLATVFIGSDDFLSKLIRRAVGPFITDDFPEYRDVVDAVRSSIESRHFLALASKHGALAKHYVDRGLTIAPSIELEPWMCGALPLEAGLCGGLLIPLPPYLLELFEKPGVCRRAHVLVCGLLHIGLVAGPLGKRAPLLPDPREGCRIDSGVLCDEDIYDASDAFPTAVSFALLATALSDLLLVDFGTAKALDVALTKPMPSRFAGLHVLPVAFCSRPAAGKFPLPAEARRRDDWTHTLTPGQMMCSPDVSDTVLCTGVLLELPTNEDLGCKCLPVPLSSMHQNRLNSTKVYHRDRKELIGNLLRVVDDITRIRSSEDCYELNEFDCCFIRVDNAVQEKFANVIHGIQLRRLASIEDLEHQQLHSQDYETPYRLYVDQELLPSVGFRKVRFLFRQDYWTKRGKGGILKRAVFQMDDNDGADDADSDGACNSPIFDIHGTVYGKFRDIMDKPRMFAIMPRPPELAHSRII
ncbi:unnamed protein product (mitochondrion) [Plasmodiophora brassicae]|uniref:Uncharacterized protein n=1 Tax=Plasmodiophora brassicae TaxID=37360 RepID=A0A3P3YNC8_PLABS|nr:unnamed protein product [Plasmodiophora brassicae]